MLRSALPIAILAALLYSASGASASIITTFHRKHIASGITTTAQDLVQTSDGGYMYVGTRYISFTQRQVTLTRTNANGQPLWCSSFGVGPVRAEGLSIIQAPDGGFVLGCYTEGSSIVNNRMMLIKVDSFGNVTAARAYDGLQFGRVRNATGGGYVIAGSRNNANGFGPGVLVKTDANLVQIAGVTVTQPVDPNGTSTSLLLNDLVEDRDGSFYVVGRRDLGGQSSRAIVMKIRGPAFPFGTIFWANDYFAAHPGLNNATSVTRDVNGDAYVGASISNSANPSANTGMCRVNTLGTPIWAKLYTGASPNPGITLAANGHPALALSIAPQDCGLMSVNSVNGSLNWVHRFGDGFFNDSLNRVIPTTDGGFAAAGFQGSSSVVYKHDGQGWIGCNQFAYSANTIVSNQTVAIPLSIGLLGPDCQVFLAHDLLALSDQSYCFAQRCAGDYNTDQQVDFFDYLDFVDDFSAGVQAADFNNDLSIDFFDYLDFVDAFSSPC